MKAQITINFEDGKFSMSAPHDKIVTYGLILLAIEAMITKGPKNLIDIPKILPLKDLKPS